MAHGASKAKEAVEPVAKHPYSASFSAAAKSTQRLCQTAPKPRYKPLYEAESHQRASCTRTLGAAIMAWLTWATRSNFVCDMEPMNLLKASVISTA